MLVYPMIGVDLNLCHANSRSTMPKQKTHKGTKKRFRITGTGKVKHRQAGTSHLAARMSKKRKRNLRGTTTLSKAMVKLVHKALSGDSY
jgi:large subunit ribosomal protein L35